MFPEQVAVSPPPQPRFHPPTVKAEPGELLHPFHLAVLAADHKVGRSRLSPRVVVKTQQQAILAHVTHTWKRSANAGSAVQPGRTKDLGAQPGPGPRRHQGLPVPTVPAREGPLGEERARHQRKASHHRGDQKGQTVRKHCGALSSLFWGGNETTTGDD